jgi:hypothetical protein
MSEKKKFELLGKGMKRVRGGVDSVNMALEEGCVCSGDLHRAGLNDPSGCACGCYGPSGTIANRSANDNIVEIQ